MTDAAPRTRRVNPLDRWILRGRDPDQPVRLLVFERLRYALLLTVLLVIIGSGVIAWSGQQKSRQVCLQRNQASMQYRVALEGLAEAAKDRGDARSAAIFRALRPPAPLPTC